MLTCNISFAGNIQEMQRAVINHSTQSGSSLLISWDAGDTVGTETQLNTFQEDSGTVSSTGVDFTPLGYGDTGHSAYVDSDGICSFTCTDGTSINLDKGTIEFDYRRPTFPDDYGIFFVLGTGASDFALRYYSTATVGNNIQFRYNGNRVDFPISTFDASGIQLDTWYHFKLDWDNTSGAGEIHRLTVNSIPSDGSFSSGTALGTKPTISVPTMYIGNEGAQVYSSNGQFDNFQIYSEVQ